MEYKDYYKILGVPKTASEKEIKAAYRKAARKHHPDVNPGDKRAEARFKEIGEAYEVLSDPEKRRRYDTLGEDWASYAQSAAGWPGGQRVRVHVGGEGADFSEFFRTFFGGGGFGGGVDDPFSSAARSGAATAVAEEPQDQELELTLEEALKGTTRALMLGEGRATRRLEVRIPAGVREGTRIRAAGSRGDLLLRVRIAPHSSFEPRGDDLATALTVPLTTAVLGGEAQVPTLEGPVGIKIPPGTPVGRVFRLRGHGLPRRDNGGRGDLLASLSVALPAQLDPRERELFEELRRLGR